jgi:hypothetical protein
MRSPVTEDDDPLRAQLYADIRPLANMSIRDALQVMSLGGEAHWKDPQRRLFSKEHSVHVRFNFYDSNNFLGLYRDSHGFKRLHSVPAEEVFTVKPVDVMTKELDFAKCTDVGKIRIVDPVFFAAVCLFISHSQIKQ